MTVDSKPDQCLDGTMNEPLREMRDQVYEQRSTDTNWNACRKYWLEQQQWLKEQYAKLPRPLPPHDSLPWPKTT
jgi:hypothetical protein